MKCTHLVKGAEVSCRALDNRYIPSLFQLFEYCRSGRHIQCPLYLQGVVCGGMDENVRTSPSFSGM